LKNIFSTSVLLSVCLNLIVAVNSVTASDVQWLWSGGVSTSEFSVRAKLVTDNVITRIAVSENANLSASLYSTLDTANTAVNNRVVAHTISGLAANTLYYYAIESNGQIDTSKIGVCKTFPSGNASFSFVLGSCSWTGSNSIVFDSLRLREPLFFCHMGDMNYENIASNNQALFRQAFEQVLGAPRQAELYRNIPIAYMWDDHDFGPNNSDSTAPGRLPARLTYQEYVPHYPLVSGTGNVPIYQAFTVGRVRFILCDSRSARSPYLGADNANKTMLGVEQKAWFKQELLKAKDSSALIVWVNTLPWIGLTGDDGWYAYTNERVEIANFIADNGINNICMISGDAHMLAIDDGTNSDYSASGCAAFPVFHAASLDRTPGIKGGPYSEGAVGGTGHFGVMSVTDNGFSIRVDWSGRTILGQELMNYSFTYPADWSQSFCQCCVGAVGNVDCDGGSIVDVADLTRLIDFLFISLSPLCCRDEANIDGGSAGSLDISDLTGLIDHLFISHDALSACQ